MIAVQSIVDKLKAYLDSEGSDYYRFDLDYKPAINSAIDFLITEMNSFYGNNKFSENAFAEISRTRIYQTNDFSRILLPASTQTDKIWTIVTVMPLPDTYPTSNILPGNPTDSFLRDDISFVRSNYTAKRLTAEEYEKNKKNPFEDGHELETGETANYYCWLNVSDYTSTGYVIAATPKTEIEIRPETANKLVGIRYVRQPTAVSLIGDNIDFPSWAEQLIVNTALMYIAIKQGDNTTAYSTASANIKALLTSIS